jgi:hypothetical protein
VKDNAGNESTSYIEATRSSDSIALGISSSISFRIGTITRGITQTFANIGGSIRNVFTGNGGASGSSTANARTANTARNTGANNRIDAARLTNMARFADAAGVNIEDLTGTRGSYQSTAYDQQLASLRQANGYTREGVPASMARTAVQKAQNTERTAVKAEAGETPAESARTGGIQTGPEERPDRSEIRSENVNRADEALIREEPETADTVLFTVAAFSRGPVTMPEPAGGGEKPRKNGGMQEPAIIPVKSREVRKGPRRKPRSSIY